MKQFTYAFASRFALIAFGAASVAAMDSTPALIVLAILAAFFATGGHSWLERNAFPTTPETEDA